MDWRIKGVVQKVLGTAPGGMRLNDALQRTLGGLRNFDGTVDSKLEDWALHQRHYQELGVDVRGLHVMEIGTGWFPTFPLCYVLAGVARCSTFDLERHLDERLTFRLLAALESRLSVVAEATGAPLSEIADRYERLAGAADLRELLRRARIDYFAPADATATSLRDDGVDVVFSNSVLEHVSPDVLDRLMVESKRVLRPGGLVVHSVNCGDHYAYFDRRINFMNYLTYSEERWSFWNNELQYQNRLRPRDFVAATERAGLSMEICVYATKDDLLAALPEMDLDPAFSHLPAEELATKSVDIVARKEAPS